jgi:hypothetical protein
VPVNHKPSFLFALFAWSLLILRFGYRFGTGDQVELLPYTLFLQNPQLYPHDFFIQGLHAAVPNERTVMAHLLLPFINHLEFFCFLFQALTTIVLVMGLEKLALRFLASRYLAWLSVLIALIPLNDFGLGNVELYSECLQAGGVAVAIAVWAINFFMERKFLATSLLMAVATFIQVLDGLDVMLVLCAVALLQLIRRQLALKDFVQLVVPYLLTAGVWLLVILQAKSGSGSGSAYNFPDEFFKILFEFRHPHHFIFATFSKFKVVVYFLLTVLALVFFYNRSKSLFQFITLATVGLCLYIIATDVFQLVFIANFQFYKVTQWVKFFGVMAGVGYIGIYLPRARLLRINATYERGLLVAGAVWCFIIIFFFNNYLPYRVPYQIASLKQKDDMLQICQSIKELTPDNSVFIQPFENTELKFHAQRSSYVEFKANVRHKAYVAEWYRRVNEVFGVHYSDKVKGFELQQRANAYFYRLNAGQLDELKKEGVTHILTGKQHPPVIGNLVTANNTYAVYKL